jgi:hypothetical protein
LVAYFVQLIWVFYGFMSPTVTKLSVSLCVFRAPLQPDWSDTGDFQSAHAAAL